MFTWRSVESSTGCTAQASVRRSSSRARDGAGNTRASTTRMLPSASSPSSVFVRCSSETSPSRTTCDSARTAAYAWDGCPAQRRVSSESPLAAASMAQFAYTRPSQIGTYPNSGNSTRQNSTPMAAKAIARSRRSAVIAGPRPNSPRRGAAELGTPGPLTCSSHANSFARAQSPAPVRRGSRTEAPPR